MEETLSRWSDFNYFFFCIVIMKLCLFLPLETGSQPSLCSPSHIEVNASQTKNELKFEKHKA